MSKATLNFKRVSSEYLRLHNESLKAIVELAGAEQETVNAKERAEKRADELELAGDVRKKYLRNSLAGVREQEKSARQRATDMCYATIVRYVDISDVNDIYHMNLEQFLRNIGVVNGDGKLNNSALKRVEQLRREVVDRVRVSVTRRKKTESTLTHGSEKALANSSIELLLAISESMTDSGKLIMTEWGLELVPEQEQEQESTQEQEQESTEQ